MPEQPARFARTARSPVRARQRAAPAQRDRYRTKPRVAARVAPRVAMPSQGWACAVLVPMAGGAILVLGLVRPAQPDDTAAAATKRPPVHTVWRAARADSALRSAPRVSPCARHARVELAALRSEPQVRLCVRRAPPVSGAKRGTTLVRRAARAPSPPRPEVLRAPPVAPGGTPMAARSAWPAQRTQGASTECRRSASAASVEGTAPRARRAKPARCSRVQSA